MRHSDGRDRYDFPTLIFRGRAASHRAGWAPYEAYVEALEAASPGSRPTRAGRFARRGPWRLGGC